MGLGIEVGMLADLRQNDEEGYQYLLQQFAAVNRALQKKGLPGLDQSWLRYLLHLIVVLSLRGG